jgi:16S rRNA (cytidine1402-2'-O)-methyltransferase
MTTETSLTTGTLYVIGTPIGNLADISFRALEIIKTLDCLLCEDTRVTRKLLGRYEITVPLESYREQVHTQRLQGIVDRLAAGAAIGLVSDAGTPAISDPGSWLVRDLLERLPSLAVVPVPGPSALTAALSVCGLPTDRVRFLGFPPHKKGRAAWFADLTAQPDTAVFYESPHRITKALESLGELAPERPLCVGRELTKLHETIYRGRPAEVLAALQAGSQKGEFVVVLGPDKLKR